MTLAHCTPAPSGTRNTLVFGVTFFRKAAATGVRNDKKWLLGVSQIRLAVSEEASVQTTAANGRDSQDPLSQIQPNTSTVRFFLAETEFKEAVAARKSWKSNPYVRIGGRIICAFGAYIFITVPQRAGESWSVFLHTKPLSAIYLLLLTILDVYVALGMPGMDVLNRHYNRFDLERQVTLTPDCVKIARGPKSWEKKWNEFVCYNETSSLYVLQTTGTQFWTVPKRAFEPSVESVFREILKFRLRRK